MRHIHTWTFDFIFFNCSSELAALLFPLYSTFWFGEGGGRNDITVF